MYFAFRDWLKMGCLDNDQDLYDDLIGPEYLYDKFHRYLIESKDDMRKRGLSSPDDGDAVVLTFAGPVARKDKCHSKRGRRARSTAQCVDYNVFG